nr:MAG TPA: hypothetical protein [Bacteriophage sp.]
MFQFTTTNVINSDKDLTTGKALYEVKNDTLVVKRVANFKKENIAAIYKAVAVDPENAKVTIDLTGVSATAGDVLRLSIYVGLSQASQDSRYSNDMIYKGKPFSVDFVWQDTAANSAKKLVETIKKYSLLVYGEKLLTASDSGAFVTIEATNEYQRFRRVDLEKFEKTPNEYPYSGKYTVIKSLSDLASKTRIQLNGTTEGFFAGKEGFGTYSFLLHNLRLPTSARTRAFGINQDETPIVGAKYNQYTIHYCANRGVLGLNAVGDTVKSVTTHVFYVKSDLAGAFEGLLEQVGSITTASAKAKDPVDPQAQSAASSAAQTIVDAAITKLKKDNSLK